MSTQTVSRYFRFAAGRPVRLPDHTRTHHKPTWREITRAEAADWAMNRLTDTSPGEYPTRLILDDYLTDLDLAGGAA